jgi:hypothetical protein
VLRGHCLCGKVTYECDAEPLATAVCHCTDCQRQTGTSFSIIVAVPRDALRVEGDSLAEHRTVGTDSEQDVARQFCRDCGSPIVSLADATPALAYIKAGTLADASSLEPVLQVWCDSAQPWVPLEAITEQAHPRGLPTA